MEVVENGYLLFLERERQFVAPTTSVCFRVPIFLTGIFGATTFVSVNRIVCIRDSKSGVIPIKDYQLRTQMLAPPR